VHALSRSKLLHLVVPGSVDPVHDRPAQVGTALGEKIHTIRQGLLLVDGQPVPPLDELVGDLDLPHRHSMSYNSL
jgi:hypothetical protein